MKKFLMIIFICLNLFAYDFVLLNSTDVDDDVIIDEIESQFKNYYYSESSQVVFNKLDNKNAILKLLDEYEYTDDKQLQEELIKNNEDLEDDLKLLFKTKYFLIVSESLDREGRTELSIKLKVDNVTYMDTNFIVPHLDDKESFYANIVANIMLTYISYKDKNFLKVHQL